LGAPVYVEGVFKNGGTRADFEEWTARGAYGLQFGSRFALCEESRMRPDLRQKIIEAGAHGKLEVATSPAMPPQQYEPLGGDVAKTKNRVCLCNGLLSTAGYYDDIEPPAVTLGGTAGKSHNRITARAIVENILTPQYVNEQERVLAAERAAPKTDPNSR
jgi:hypothetical protein